MLWRCLGRTRRPWVLSLVVQSRPAINTLTETQAKHALATQQQLQTENDKLAREIESLRASSSTKSLETELTLLRKQNKELTAQQATTAKSSAIPIPTSFSRIPTCKSIPSSGRATPDSTNVSLLERLNVLESEASLAQKKITELNVLQRSKDAEIQRLNECLQNVREEYRKADELVTKMVEVDGRKCLRNVHGAKCCFHPGLNVLIELFRQIITL
ncbi:hypothetical protein BDR26DRAFT_476178 [Obelidium mucronatum]|nr:hypothetical protein BDR26DRAFT_476178 [Obelidium mucronatum]